MNNVSDNPNKLELNSRNRKQGKLIVWQILLFSFVACFLICAAFVIVLVTNDDGYDTTTIDGIVYTCREDGWVVTGIANPDTTHAEITNYINDVPVIELGKFNNYKSLESIYIPSTVNKISCQFELLTNLKKIDVSNESTMYASVDGVLYSKDFTRLIRYPVAAVPSKSRYKLAIYYDYIDSKAFMNCTNLVSLELSNSTLSIGSNAFARSSIESITLYSSLVSVGDMAFYDCKNLKSVLIPYSVELIGNGAFAGCSNLANISVSTLNSNFTALNGVLYSADLSKLIAYPSAAVGEVYTINSQTLSISPYAFAYSANLNSIAIPDNVVSIGENAFANSEKLKNVIIEGDGVVSVNALDVYSATVNFFVDSEVVLSYLQDDSWKLAHVFPYHKDEQSDFLYMTVQEAYLYGYYTDDLANNNIANNDNGCIITGCISADKEIICPDSVKCDGVEMYALTYTARAFCAKTVTDFTNGDNIVYIPSDCFKGFTYLCEIELNNSLQSIGSSAFMDCVQLKEVKFSSYSIGVDKYFKLNIIGKNAFYGCSSLTMIEFHMKAGNGALLLDEDCFTNCPGLQYVSTACLFEYLAYSGEGTGSSDFAIYVKDSLYEQFYKESRKHERYWQMDSKDILYAKVLNDRVFGE
ncbi:MAG: leucine-rich repeat domain-containing protein [Clostridia bacterium]|nr:leucine-rich repeat domain-containing protein [Clostridia bacterium]